MKKSIVIALAVALATSAQAEWVDYYANSTEYVNPYKGNAYDYVSQERTHGQWYIDNESQYNSFGKWKNERYPVLEEYNNEIFLKVGCGGSEYVVENKEDYYKFVYLCVGFDFLDSSFFTSKKDFYINLKAKVFKQTDGSDECFIPCLYYINDDDKWLNIYNYSNSNSEESGFESWGFVDGNKIKVSNKDNIEPFEVSAKLPSKRFVVQFSLYEKDFYYFKDIEISITDGNGEVYFKRAYFTEEERRGLAITSLNNSEVESGIYVSNNVLYTGEPSNVCIYNTSGILVKAEHSVTTLDLSDLKKGVYIAKVNGAPIRFVR